MKLSFITQDDYLQNYLSVEESLFYASELLNISDVDHKKNVQRVVKLLNIENCLNVRPNRCSGGERKRISIALELVSRPDLLILDEPTTGLDSVTTWQLINTLLGLSKISPPMAVAMTIHQPSGRLFKLLNSVYVMSYTSVYIHGLTSIHNRLLRTVRPLLLTVSQPVGLCPGGGLQTARNRKSPSLYVNHEK